MTPMNPATRPRSPRKPVSMAPVSGPDQRHRLVGGDSKEHEERDEDGDDRRHHRDEGPKRRAQST